MDINKVMGELDALFDEGKTGHIGPFLEEHIEQAADEQDNEALLMLYNEAVGFFRETGEYGKTISNCSKALELIENMGIQGTIPYATTLLNIANAYRAAGLLKESLEFYNKVQPIYDAQLSPDDMYYAGLYNNMSLLFQEMKDFRSAKDYLQKALDIVVKKEDKQFETAVTHANLANTCIELGEDDEAKARAEEAIRIFEEIGVDDAHYSAALSALGSLYYMDKNYEEACRVMEKSRDCVAKYLGTENIQYQRLSENIALIRSKIDEQTILPQDEEEDTEQVNEDEPAELTEENESGLPEPADDEQDLTPEISGMELCRKYYEEYGRPMISEKFHAYEKQIAVGLVGKGSDCFGFDDKQSADHDFGPRFAMWLTKETYESIGEELQKAYDELPSSFMGYERNETFHGRDRAGVIIIEDFYKNILGFDLIGKLEQCDNGEDLNTVKCWLAVHDHALAAAVNGEVFRDDEGIFTRYRNRLSEYYPKAVWYRKIAQACALFSQNGQYNLPRMRRRGQLVSAELAKAECMKYAMKLTYLLNRKYSPHDKWLFKGLPSNDEMYIEKEDGSRVYVDELLQKMSLLSVTAQDEVELTYTVEALAVIFANELERLNIVGKSDVYLDANTNELTSKSDALLTAIMAQTPVTTALSLSIAKAEFEAFDKVRNEGGRADCQNNWPTFKVMRMSQYMTWDEDMLLQYLYEFKTNYANGRNMIEEKYARMMESTAPLEYARFADLLPAIPKEKQDIIEGIVELQVRDMEEFSVKYPKLAGNARTIHTSDDLPYDTSYETYLRGELGTYSDKMLDMYGRYIVEHVRSGKNVAQEIMENTIHFYGYKDLEAADENGIDV